MPIVYKGFKLLAMASQEYGIGATGTIIQGIGRILSGTVLIGADNHLASIPKGASAEEVSLAFIRLLVYIVLVSLISLIGGIMVLIAIRRLETRTPSTVGMCSR